MLGQEQDALFSSESGFTGRLAHASGNEADSSADLSQPSEPQSSTVGKRVKGFFMSYLPTLSSKAVHPPSQKSTISRKPGLPLPPPNILDKVRGPVTTPARHPLPKPVPPKELVQLHPAPPVLPSVLPRPAKPQRLVELHHLPPPPEKPIVASNTSLRPRRSSGASVKDLVKGFEDIDRLEKEKLNVNPLRKPKGIDSLRKKGEGSGETRPRWRF